jgi:hypothetical protein
MTANARLLDLAFPSPESQHTSDSPFIYFAEWVPAARSNVTQEP